MPHDADRAPAERLCEWSACEHSGEGAPSGSQEPVSEEGASLTGIALATGVPRRSPRLLTTCGRAAIGLAVCGAAALSAGYIATGSSRARSPDGVEAKDLSKSILHELELVDDLHTRIAAVFGIGGASSQAPEALSEDVKSGGDQADHDSLPVHVDGDSTSLPFPKGDYQKAIDYLPVTTFFNNWRSEAKALPALVRKFDMLYGLQANLQGWNVAKRDGDVVIVEGDGLSDPRTVLCCSNFVHRFLDYAKEHFDSSHNNRTIVFAGTETPLSETWGVGDITIEALVSDYRKYFRNILYYATDVPLVGVRTMPVGFTEMYMQDRTDQFLEAYVAASVGPSSKTGSVLAAWGLYTAQGGDWHFEYHEGVVDNYGASSASKGWVDTANVAIDIRNAANAWIESPEGRVTGVEKRMVPKPEWWSVLSKYRFILCPLGTAIQLSKVPEALSMLTVPIVMRGPYRTYDDIINMGFPIVVVESWNNITTSSLETWWRRLSPRLEKFRAECLTTEGYWRLFTQGIC